MSDTESSGAGCCYSGLCPRCIDLVRDVVCGDTCSNDRWRTLRSDHATLSYCTSHWDGDFEKLKQATWKCCKLCSLILQKVLRFNDGVEPASYHVFVWGNRPNRCEVQVITEDIQAFTRHVSERKQQQTLLLAAQQRAVTTLPELQLPPIRTNEFPRPYLTRLPSRDLSSEQGFSLASKWLQECTSPSHPKCRRSTGWMPKRILDLSKLEENNSVSILVTSNESKPYAALSYTWGDTVRLTLKRRQNGDVPDGTGPLAQHAVRLSVSKNAPLEYKAMPERWYDTSAIPWDVFPSSLKDAVRIAHRLAFRYLWIDSLCIIQGDDDDWAHQGAEMTAIYGNSTVTISASNTKSSTEPILQRLESDRVELCVLKDAEGNEQGLFAGDLLPTYDLEAEHISTRGWVFQERLVSPATLHYTSQGMVWECANGFRLDRDQGNSSKPWKREWQSLVSLTDPLQISSPEKGFEAFYGWVAAYSGRDLWDSRDKLPAMAGIAKSLATSLPLPNQEECYAAGLWRQDFLSGLLWQRFNRTPSLTRLEQPYVGPSWSWASVNGTLEYKSVELASSSQTGPRLEIVKIYVEEERRGLFGRILSAHVVVSGQLQQITVDRRSHPGSRKRAFEECGISSGFVNNENALCMLDELSELDDQYLECWCLRVGSQVLRGGRQHDWFLVLKRPDDSRNDFKRTGLIKCDGWFDSLVPTPDSGRLTSPVEQELTIS